MQYVSLGDESDCMNCERTESRRQIYARTDIPANSSANSAADTSANTRSFAGTYTQPSRLPNQR